jgi:hypothetical protein
MEKSGPRVRLEVLWERITPSPSGNRRPDNNTKGYLIYIECVDAACTEMFQDWIHLLVIVTVYTYIAKKERRKEKKCERTR